MQPDFVTIEKFHIFPKKKYFEYNKVVAAQAPADK